jgi:ribosomal protein L9
MNDRKNQGRGLAKVSHLFLSGPEPPKEKVTIQVAARALGVSKGTIITYLNKGQLTRIKEAGRIYVSMDEVRAFADTKRKQVKPVVTASAERNKRASVNRERDGSKRPVASVVLEIERKYLLKYKAALEAKDKKLEKLTFEVNELKQNVEIQSNEWKGIQTRLRDLEKQQQKQLGEFKSTTNVLHQDLLEKIQARLLKVEKEMKNLRRPWWQELFGHLRPRPELSGKNGMVLLGALALLTVLTFSGWWVNRSEKQPPSPVAEGQPSESGTVQAPAQAVVEAELQQEQSAGVVQQSSEPLHTSGKPQPEPAARDAQNAQLYTSRAEESSSEAERVSPQPEGEQNVVGLSSIASPYFLRAETQAATWLQVIIDEKQELEYLLHPNENHTWRAMSNFRVHIGNAAGLRLYLNDQPLKPLGESGEVVHLQLPDPSLIATSTSEHAEPVTEP